VSSAHSGFQLEAIFTSGFVLKSEIIFAGAAFSNFSFCLVAIFTSWICSQCHIVFVGAVFFYLFNAIIIMPGKQLQSTYFLSLAATDSM